MGSVESKAGDVIQYAETEEEFTESLRNNLQRLIIYAEAAPADMQREVAERLANEAVKCGSARGNTFAVRMCFCPPSPFSSPARRGQVSRLAAISNAACSHFVVPLSPAAKVCAPTAVGSKSIR